MVRRGIGTQFRSNEKITMARGVQDLEVGKGSAGGDLACDNVKSVLSSPPSFSFATHAHELGLVDSTVSTETVPAEECLCQKSPGRAMEPALTRPCPGHRRCVLHPQS